MLYYFPISGVETNILYPFAVALGISFFTSMGGVSGAFLILPFQVSVLGFASPSVSATNFLYNVIGTPGGITRYVRERRMVWPLALCIAVGTLPGVLIGYYVRVVYLPDPRNFKFFVGLVLVYIGARLARSIVKAGTAPGSGGEFTVENVAWSLRHIRFDFRGRPVCASTTLLFLLTFVVGIIGGIYGIGGGAIIAPFCVSVMNIPVYTVAGPAMFGTFVTSILGVLFYTFIPLNSGQAAPPDWLLGLLFGLGGMVGMYLGARFQRFVPERMIKGGLALIILAVSVKYILQFFG